MRTLRCKNGKSIEFLEPRLLLAGDAAATLGLHMRDSYLPAIPFLVRAQMEFENGQIDKSVWDQVVQISSDNPDVTLSESEIQLTNGLGTIQVVVQGNADFSIVAQVQDQTVSKNIRSLVGNPITSVSGTLESNNVVWSNIVSVESDVVVDAGQTLTIEPGTLVLIDGVPITQEESLGSVITVRGSLHANGTIDSPVTLTAANPEEPWGEVNIDGGQVTFTSTNLSRAGNSSRGGHTGTGPAIRLQGSGVVAFDSANITDIRGKIMQADSGEITAISTTFARAVMGPEIENTGLVMEQSWITDMVGVYRFDGSVDDNDAIYLHSQAQGQSLSIRGGVIARTQDDGVDTLGANGSFSDIIIRDIEDKGVSILRGANEFDRVLIVNADIGFNAKGVGNNVVDVSIRRSTIAKVNTGIWAEDKDEPDPNVTINYDVRDSIIQVNPGGSAVRTDYDPALIKINYSMLSNEWNHDGSGAGNLYGDPLFENADQHRFHLTSDSPAVDAGDPESQPDPDNTRSDMGSFYFDQAATVPGDFNSDHIVNETDIDLLCNSLHDQEADFLFDLNDDKIVSLLDLKVLVENLLGTSFGDSSLDGRFDSTDLVQVFQQGQYEDKIEENSVWSTGDWDCDHDFTTSDLVLAFQAGKYLAEGTAVSTVIPYRLVISFAAVDNMQFDNDKTKLVKAQNVFNQLN